MTKKLSIFVNSSDGFEDCWIPFFHLFEKYGGNLNDLSIYLNTEHKDFKYEGIDIITTKVASAWDKKLTWSECLSRGLKQVDSDYVLYLQEDYFLTRLVNFEMICRALTAMNEDRSIGAIYLNRFGPVYHRSKKRFDGFEEIISPARYLLSTQAAIWQKNQLQGLVRKWENGWMFEKFGSARALKSSARFLSVDHQTMIDDPVFEYIYTGIMKGQWNQEVVDLFNKESLTLDYEKRGFYQHRGRLKSRLEVLMKISKNPINTLRSIASI
jgi:hypothetical protein